MPSGPAALLHGVRRKASCMIAGVIHPAIIGAEVVGDGQMCLIQGKGAPGRSEGSGERATVSIYASLEINSSGEVMRRSMISSRSSERSVGREEVSVAPFAVRRIDFSDTLGFL